MAEKFIPDYQHLWDTMIITPSKKGEIVATAKNILANRSRYESIEKQTTCPWFVVAIIHNTECSLSFEKHLFNGDSLEKRTVRAPVGYPKNGTPPFTWDFSAVEAIKYDELNMVKEWSMPSILENLERYNGFGYRKNGKLTPYLWSYTNHYTSGKYVEEKQSNGTYKSIYKPDLVSQQIGSAPLLKYLTDKTLGLVK